MIDLSPLERQRIEIPPVNPAYRLQLVLVSLFMILLPLIYLCIIAGTAWGLYWHSTEHIAWFDGSRSARGVLFAYITPLIAGGLLLIFMIKPLFARAQEDWPGRVVNRQDEPGLFRFVETICQAVNAPVPAEIVLNCDVNAGAMYRRGWLSLFHRDLRLIIGLPLVAGLELSQLAGVLAHEFGHFSQGAGMRSSYIIRNINAWFWRVVHERDGWDLQLEAWSRNSDFRIMLVLWTARLFIGLTRWILKGLMWSGHAVSCAMSRQMEFDADLYEIRLAGSDTFRRTALALPVLNVAAQRSMTDLSSAWEEKRLCSDYPGLVSWNQQRMPAGVREEVEVAAIQTSTGWFDTHPADLERIMAAETENHPGIFHSTEPASIIFCNFALTCQQTSRDWYAAMLGGMPADEAILDFGEFRQRSEEEEAEKAALDHYLPGLAWGIGPLRIVEFSPPDSEREIRIALKNAAIRLQNRLEEFQEIFKRMDAADDRRLDGLRAIRLLEAGFRLRNEDFGLTRGTKEEAEKMAADAAAEWQQAAIELKPLDELFSQRIQLAVALVSEPQARRAAGITDADYRQVQDFIELWPQLLNLMDAALKIREQVVIQEILFAHWQDHQGDEALNRVIGRELQDLHEKLTAWQPELSAFPCLFPRGDGVDNLAAACLPVPLPDADDGGIHDVGTTTMKTVLHLYFRMLARLALFGEKVEAIL